MDKYKCIIAILVVIIIPTFSFADDIDVEIFKTPEQSVEVFSKISEIPVINAKHAIVLDRASKTILYGKHEYEMCKMASTTKIMTAIIVLENCSNLNEIVNISKKSARNRWF